MMEHVWDMSLETWLAYWGEGWHVYLFLLCLPFLFFWKKMKGERRILAAYTLVVLAIFFLPLTAHVIADYCIGKTVYWRVLWLLPVAPVIAYVCTRVSTAWKNAGIQMILGAVFLGVIVCTGSQVYVEGNFQMPDVPEKVPYQVKAIADLVREESGRAEKKKLVAPDEIATYMRIYAPDIQMPYGRGSRGTKRGAAKQLHILLGQDAGQTDPGQVSTLVRDVRCNYLVMWVEDPQTDQKYEENGFTLVGMVDQYHIYKRTRN